MRISPFVLLHLLSSCCSAAAMDQGQVAPAAAPDDAPSPLAGSVKGGERFRDIVDVFERASNRWREETFPKALSKRLGRFDPNTVASASAWHFAMMNDEERGLAYRDALVRAVRPGDTVLEVGTGGGLLAMMAGRIARERGGHVYTAEGNPDLATLAGEVVSHNGLADHVTVKNKMSTLTTPEDLGGRRADVIFSETIGTSILVEGQIEWMRDARARLASEGVRIIPGSARQFITLAQSPTWDRVTRVTHIDGLDLTPFNQVRDTSQFFWSRRYGLSFKDFDFRDMSLPIPVFHIDFYTTTWDDLPRRRVFEVPVLSDGVVHGAYTYFDLYEHANKTIPMVSTHPKNMTLEREVGWGLHYAAVGEEENGGAPFEVRRGEVLVVTVWYVRDDPSDVGFRIDVQRKAANKEKEEL